MHLHTLQPSSADYLKNYKSNQESFYSIAVNYPRDNMQESCAVWFKDRLPQQGGECVKGGWFFFQAFFGQDEMGEDDNLFMIHSASLPFLSFGGEERKENTLEGS